MRPRRSQAHARCAAPAIALVILAAGCGGDDRGPAPAESVTGGTAAVGRMVFRSEGCGACHAVGAAGSHGTIGPNLAESLAGRPVGFIRESIVDPNASIASGYPRNTMPRGYGRTLAKSELDALVDFLAAAAATKRSR